MNFEFKTIGEFNEYFKDEAACYVFLERERWQGYVVCPHCGSTKNPYSVKSRSKNPDFSIIPSYRCSERACDLPFTVRTGTIFEGSKITLRKWFQAAYELSIRKKGISSVELAQRIDVSQKTAWHMNHRLRMMIDETSPEMLTDIVEIDETYIGGNTGNKRKRIREAVVGTGYVNKTPVVGMLQRGGKVLTVAFPNTDKVDGSVLKPLIRERVSLGANLMTDGFGAYANLHKEFASHEIVNHAKDEYVRGNIHTNSVEGFFSQLKRTVYGTHHWVSRKHLQRYCTETSFKYNERGLSSPARFYITFKNINNEKITYKELTEKKLIY